MDKNNLETHLETELKKKTKIQYMAIGLGVLISILLYVFLPNDIYWLSILLKVLFVVLTLLPFYYFNLKISQISELQKSLRLGRWEEMSLEFENNQVFLPSNKKLLLFGANKKMPNNGKYKVFSNNKEMNNKVVIQVNQDQYLVSI